MKERRMWGGRFSGDPSDLLRALNDSFAVDRALLDEDIEGSIAWAGALKRAGVLKETEARRITRALDEIREACAAKPPDTSRHEDVHSFVEAALESKVGALAGKLHTGRSRNDQVATDFRLHLLRALGAARAASLDLAAALARRAIEEAATPMPGYTHLKQAEPVTFGHWCLAYVEMLLRDADRLRAARDRGDECPLGSAALAGTPLPIDRNRLAKSLGFARPSANSIDAVSDRDTALDFLAAASILLVHLSRLAEDLIFFTSDEAAYIELPDDLATGSSRMPHKKNPDILELTRGHAARAIGDLTGLLTLMKGLPLAYDKDLQLDKEPVFRAGATLALVLPAMSAIVDGVRLNRERMREAASGDLPLATELADSLARRGVAFREAHEIVGRRVAAAVRRRVALADLPVGSGVTRADLAALDVMKALTRRRALGGTAPVRVRAAARAALARIGRTRGRR
ncbi:MAG TPA: argininosuccinate lyase [Verrucomicrobiae bacterium]|nr:argininosuccinate lyase [Verrucomicrobiae bacterium]